MTDRRPRTPSTPYPELFPDRELTRDERAAHDEDPRPGSCFSPHTGESHLVTQSDTDILIRVELWSQAPESARALFEKLIGVPRWRPGSITDPLVPTTYQRGGIDTDPFVRLLAYRAWGDRDRTWFSHRGVRAGDLVAAAGNGPRSTIRVACAWSGETVLGTAAADARPGELVEVVPAVAPPPESPESRDPPEARASPGTRFRVADRPRAEPRDRTTPR
jgi:hypothetical protein